MKQLHLLRIVVSLVVFFCCGVGLAVGQEITGSLVGTVKDSNGATVKGATVTITNSDTKLVARTITTNDDGEIFAPLLPAALSDITVEATGFKRHIAQPLN